MQTSPHRLPHLSFVLLLGVILSGCAAKQEAVRVRAADLSSMPAVRAGQPLIIEFDRGDTIPLTFDLEGPLVRSPEGADPIQLRVVRHFFLRIDGDGLRSSADGEHFDKPVKPGSFRLGMGATKGGPKASLTIRTPTPPGL